GKRYRKLHLGRRHLPAGAHRPGGGRAHGARQPPGARAGRPHPLAARPRRAGQRAEDHLRAPHLFRGARHGARPPRHPGRQRQRLPGTLGRRRGRRQPRSVSGAQRQPDGGGSRPHQVRRGLQGAPPLLHQRRSRRDPGEAGDRARHHPDARGHHQHAGRPLDRRRLHDARGDLLHRRHVRRALLPGQQHGLAGSRQQHQLRHLPADAERRAYLHGRGAHDRRLLSRRAGNRQRQGSPGGQRRRHVHGAAHLAECLQPGGALAAVLHGPQRHHPRLAAHGDLGGGGRKRGRHRDGERYGRARRQRRGDGRHGHDLRGREQRSQAGLQRRSGGSGGGGGRLPDRREHRRPRARERRAAAVGERRRNRRDSHHAHRQREQRPAGLVAGCGGLSEHLPQRGRPRADVVELARQLGQRRGPAPHPVQQRPAGGRPLPLLHAV
ncbi:MAG: hypothetical protein AVDCRST_MAG89-5120, partial [uncultured Gemmatimonadetes bacterium]